MDIIVKLTTAGASIGPTFNLYSNVDNYTTAFVTNISKASLLSGYYTNLAPANTTTVRIKSMGVDCTNFVNVTVLPPTTTTTTTFAVTIDFTIEIVTNNIYANPAIITYGYTGSPSGKYGITTIWKSTEAEASNPYNYGSTTHMNWTYFYQGFNQPPINYGFPPGTYWFGVRDFDNYLNMRVKSMTVPETTTSTTTII
jgi:hypothetical protein